MKKTLIFTLMIILLTGCVPAPSVKTSQVTLEGKQWEPVNKNYMNKKDF